MTRLAPLAFSALLASGLLATSPAWAQPVPAPPGASRQLVLGADGVQAYACEARDGAHAWVFKGPEAALFDEAGRQVGTHGAGPHWRLAAGNALITAEPTQSAPASAPGAIPWLLLRTREASGSLSGIRWIRRIDTSGGTAPPGPCEPGATLRMRYSAVYEFLGG